MSKALEPGQCYAGRNANASIVNVTVTRDVHDMLRQYAHGRRSMGRFISELVLQYHVKQEAKRELREELEGVLR